MQIYIVAFLIVSIVLQLGILVQVYRGKWPMRFSGQATDETSGDVVKLLNAYNKMVAVKWYTDMITEGDFGDLNIAQIQFLHQMSIDTNKALQELQAVAGNAKVDHANLKKAAYNDAPSSQASSKN